MNFKKFKKTLSKIGAFALAALITATTLATSVSAATTSDTSSKLHSREGWGYDFRGLSLPAAYDPIDGTRVLTGSNPYYDTTGFWTFKTANGNIAYCVQIGEHSVDGVNETITKLDDSNAAKKLYPNSTQRNHLRYALTYAYKGTAKYGFSAEIEQVASQVLVWTISAKYFDDSTTGLSATERTFLSAIKVGSNHDKLEECYKKMKTDVLRHKTVASKMYASATQAKAHVNTLKYNASTNRYECTVKSDSYLSHFTAPALSGVTLTRNGNDLKISATTTGVANLEKLGTIKFVKTRNVYSTSIADISPIVLTANDNQAKVSYTSGSTDPVEGYMAFEGATGSFTVTKTAADANGKTYTVTKNNNSSLNSAVTFKIKSSSGYWVNATKPSENGTSSYRFTRADKTATGQNFKLNADGKFNISGLPTGTYTLVETATATGYSKAADKKFTVTADKTTSQSVENKQQSGKLSVKKQLNNAGTIVAVTDFSFVTASGESVDWEELCQTIRFKIMDSSGKYITASQPSAYSGNYTYTGANQTGTSFGLCYKTGANNVTPGTFEVKNLPVGSYTIIETQRDDWGTTKPHTFAEMGVTSSSNISASIKSGGTTSKTVTNKTTSNGDLTILKNITLGDKSEPRAEDYAAVSFTVQDESGNYLTFDCVSDKSGTYSFSGIASSESEATLIKLGTETHQSLIKNLTPDKYAITENVAPTFTAISDSLEVTIASDAEAKLEFTNAEKTGSIEVKKSTEGNLNVSNIEFILSGTSDSGREIEVKATTDENGVATFENIPIGTYAVVENGESVPTAYLTAGEQEVTVSYAQTTEVEFVNIEKTGSIEVKKATEGNLNVSNIEFILSGTSDSGREIEVKAPTNENGVATFENIPVGTYVVTENGETVPYAYLTATEQEVTVSYAQTTEVEFFNAEKTGSIEVKKSTEGDFNISDIEFILSGTSDSGREIEIKATTNENGVIEFVLPEGKYYYQEIKAPDGYLIDTNKYEFTISVGDITTAHMTNEKIPETPSIPDVPQTGLNSVRAEGVILPAITLVIAAAVVFFKKKER